MLIKASTGCANMVVLSSAISMESLHLHIGHEISTCCLAGATIALTSLEQPSSVEAVYYGGQQSECTLLGVGAVFEVR